MFCWICHKKSRQEVKCSTCILSFHMNCMPDINRKNVGWKCNECKCSESGGEGWDKFICYLICLLIKCAIFHITLNRNLGNNSLRSLLKNLVDRLILDKEVILELNFATKKTWNHLYKQIKFFCGWKRLAR